MKSKKREMRNFRDLLLIEDSRGLADSMEFSRCVNDNLVTNKRQ